MRVEFDFLVRADYANLLRARALRLRELAEDRTMSATREELLAEARWREERAKKMDDAFEERVLTDREPIKVDARRDIDSVDAPNGSSGA